MCKRTTLSNGQAGLRATIQVTARATRNPDPERSTAVAPLPGDANQSCLDFVASDESLDRCGEIICASGWRLETYRRNPVFQNAHQYGDILFTLGKALITEVRNIPRVSQLSTINPQLSTVLFQRIQFATDVNPVARIAYGLYKGGFLSAVSVGFIPLRWEDANGIEHSSPRSSDGRGAGGEGAAEEKDEGPRTLSLNPQPPHRRYLEQELLEVSAVAIPANPEALALGIKSGAVTKADLADALDLLRSLTALQHGLGSEFRLQPVRIHNVSRQTAHVPEFRAVHTRPGIRQVSTDTTALINFARELRRILRRA